MTLTLPEPVSVYLKIANGVDIEDVVHVFAPDAVVFDEGRTHRGHDAIKSWQREAQKKFTYTVTPVSVAPVGDRLKVVTRVEGDFPGSPVQLDHVFGLVEGKITSLEIS
ncbi:MULTISPECIES: nuclear transport factor 2 family protein [Bordetella]|uniref:Polyketide cyclase n=1 Tax=Bordetella genomosp. 7 TaxID=1416805 RepID=A0A261RRH0_9BORD|nr:MULTISPECIES: nuclear transport factor 2 family protein [Bordetella]OZI27501.1 polyketide cyclase [Bordetella genomosp. 7]